MTSVITFALIAHTKFRMHGILTEHGTFSFSDDDDDDIEGGEGGEGGEENSWEDSGFATYGKQSKELFDKTFQRLVNDDKTSLRLRSIIAFLVYLFFLCAPVLVPHHSMPHVSISWILFPFSSLSPCTSLYFPVLPVPARSPLLVSPFSPFWSPNCVGLPMQLFLFLPSRRL